MNCNALMASPRCRTSLVMRSKLWNCADKRRNLHPPFVHLRQPTASSRLSSARRSQRLRVDIILVTWGSDDLRAQQRPASGPSRSPITLHGLHLDSGTQIRPDSDEAQCRCMTSLYDVGVWRLRHSVGVWRLSMTWLWGPKISAHSLLQVKFNP